MYKVNSLNSSSNQLNTTKNFLKDGISLVSSNNKLIKKNKLDLSQLRKDLEHEFELKDYPQTLSLELINSKSVRENIQLLLSSKDVKEFLKSLSFTCDGEDVVLFPFIQVMRNYFSGPQQGKHGWHNDLRGEWDYPYCCERIMSGNYIFGKLSIALQNNGIMGGNIDIALSTFNKGKGSKSLRQKISNKLQLYILQLFKKVNIPLFSIGDLWITDLISLITTPRSINPDPLQTIAFDHSIHHRGTPHSPLGWQEVLNHDSTASLTKDGHLQKINLHGRNKYMIYMHFGNKVGLESYLYDRSRRKTWASECEKWVSQYKNLNLFSKVSPSSEKMFISTCKDLSITF